jgi:hypothetical protein
LKKTLIEKRKLVKKEDCDLLKREDFKREVHQRNLKKESGVRNKPDTEAFFGIDSIGNMRNQEQKNQEVTERINVRFKSIFNESEGEYQPYVCLICDEFITSDKMECITETLLQQNGSILKPATWNAATLSLRNCYELSNNDGYDSEDQVSHTDDNSEEENDGDASSQLDTSSEETDDIESSSSKSDENQIAKMLLSPRASFIHHADHRKIDGYSCCISCKNSLKNGRIPKYAIANNYCVGTPPQCLIDLTDIELAMVTPVKTFGYCFSYTGGKQKQLKGSLAYYKVKMESIARAAMHFDVLGLHNNIVILLYGEMTMAQISKVRQKGQIRTNYILRAIEWLLAHNDEWKKQKICLRDIKRKLVNPLVVDNSITVEGEIVVNNNIESTESFNVYFPDGTMTAVSGGQENLQAFNDLVKQVSASGYDIGFRSNLIKEAVSDFKDNNLVNACLLQFPYGRGGMHELRQQGNGKYSTTTDIQEYIDHLSRLSQPQFHHELFTLILYNLSMKQSMVRMATWRVRNKCNAKMLAKELTIEDLSTAISSRQTIGTKRDRSGTAQHFLDAVDAITRAVPHTNEAAKQARSNGECIQHNYGAPSLFLTVTPDDDNSLIVQVLAADVIDDETCSSLQTDQELITKARTRTALRIKYPGICALFLNMS